MIKSTNTKASPKAGSPYFLDIIVCSGEGPEKNYPLLRALAAQAGAEVRFAVLCSEPAEGPVEDFGPYVEFRYFPGSSAIDLRGIVPAETGRSEWTIVLEDHVSVTIDWLRALRRTLEQVPEDTSCVIGTAENLTSHEPWSWANFLNVQIYHWAPNLVEPVRPLGFNVAYRTRLLPDRPLKPGEFEVACVPELMKKPVASTAFPADHIQHRFLPEVLYYHYCNGRVSGAAIRDFHPGGLRHTIRHALSNLGPRRREVARLIRAHPHKGLLPAGILWRVAVLAACHSAGAIVGGIIGPGRAAWALE